MSSNFIFERSLRLLQKGNRIGGLNNYTDVLAQQKCITTSADTADIAILLDLSIKSLSIQPL